MTARLAVRLTPRGGADRVDGVGEDGALRVRVAAPPVDGAANDALCRLLARELRIANGAVRIVGGAAARWKLVELDVEPARLAAAWPGLGDDGRSRPGARSADGGRTGADTGARSRSRPDAGSGSAG